MESKSEKVVVTNWVVGPTEDVVQALMERLVYPRLPRTAMANNTNPPSYEEQKAVARQMHAVVLLYNYYHRKQKPDLKFLDLFSFCNLAVVLKPSLEAFMKVTQEKKLWELNDAECQFSLTEKAMKSACDITAALDASVEVPNTEGWPISKVAVLLIDSKKENCKLQFGAVTEGVWSPFEKELEEKLSGGKKKSDNLMAVIAGNEILQICYDLVTEITGTESNELLVLGSEVAYSLNEEKSTTQFYLVQLPGSGTISREERIPLKLLVEKLEGPLAEPCFGTWSSTEVVNYFHMLPYAGFISRWLSGKDSCVPSVHSGFAQSSSISNSSVSANTVKDSDHTDNDSPRKTTTSSGETANKNANQRRDTAKKNSSYFEKLVKDMSERGNGQKSVKVFERKGCSPKNVAAEIGEMRKVRKKCEIATVAPENEERRTDSHNILDKMEIEDGKVSGESKVAILSDQIQNAFTANANNPADHNQLRQNEGTTELTGVVENDLASSEELQNALLLCIRREQLFAQVPCKDTLTQYENCIERIWDGGDVGLARRRIQSIMRGNNHWMLMNETKMHDKQNSKSQTEKQSSWLSGIFVPGKSKCQDMEYMHPKNNWKGPRYLVEQSEDTVDSLVKFIEDKKRKALTYNELCAKMGKKQKTSPSKVLATVANVEMGEASKAALSSTEKVTNPLGKSGGEPLKIVLGQGAHLHLDSSAIRGGGNLLLDDDVHQMGTVEASTYALPLIIKLLNAMISINQNTITSEEKESLKFAYQDVLKDNENLKASLLEEKTKSEAFKQQLEGMKGQLQETKGLLESERVVLTMLRDEVEKIEARAIAKTRRDLMMEVINGENANWVPAEQVETCDEMLWRIDNGGGLEGGDDHKRT